MKLMRFYKSLLNVGIALLTGLIGWSLVFPTKLLFNFSNRLDYSNYEMLYMSCILPIGIFSVLIPLLEFIKEFNTVGTVNRGAVSLLLFNIYSVTLLYLFFPLHFFNTNVEDLIYQVFLSLSGYITFVYGLLVIRRAWLPRV